MSQKYHIQSESTKYYIISDDNALTLALAVPKTNKISALAGA